MQWDFHHGLLAPIAVAASGPILVRMMTRTPPDPARQGLGSLVPVTLLAALTALAGCTTAEAPDDANGPRRAETEAVAQSATDPVEPELVFINLLPWGQIDFARGEFASLGTCNAFVRALPTYSFYTTSERCQPIEEPVYCTVWRDEEDDRNSIGCHKGPGGCEIELRRHDLAVEAEMRTISARCEPYALADAWQRYRVATEATASAPK